MSRTDARSSTLRRRPSRTIPATIAALVLIAVGVALVWAAVVRIAQGSWPDFATQTASWVGSLTWGSVATLLVSVGIAVLGVVAFVAAIKPGLPTAMTVDHSQVRNSAGGAEVVMSRRAVAKLATARAGTIDGVDSVSAAVGSRKVRLSIRTPSEQRAELEQQAGARVTEALQAAGLNPVPTVTVSARTHRP